MLDIITAERADTVENISVPYAIEVESSGSSGSSESSESLEKNGQYMQCDKGCICLFIFVLLCIFVIIFFALLRILVS